MTTLAPMSGLNAQSFQIGHTTGLCAATGRPLVPGDHFIAALVEPALDGERSDELVRLDYSLDAWSAGSRPQPPARLFGYWKAVVLPPSARPHALIDDDGLLDLFEQLAEETDPRRVAFRFVLALILIRKRLLVLEGSRPGLMLVRPRGTPRPPEGPATLEVTDPGLDDAAIDAVIEQLEAVMPGATASGAQGGTA